jgi:hypothetical protein
MSDLGEDNMYNNGLGGNMNCNITLLNKTEEIEAIFFEEEEKIIIEFDQFEIVILLNLLK